MRDIEYLKSMYPSGVKVLQTYVSEACDRMEYKNSPMYDEFPDQLMVNHLCETICDTIIASKDNEMVGTMWGSWKKEEAVKAEEVGIEEKAEEPAEESEGEPEEEAEREEIVGINIDDSYEEEMLEGAVMQTEDRSEEMKMQNENQVYENREGKINKSKDERGEMENSEYAAVEMGYSSDKESENLENMPIYTSEQEMWKSEPLSSQISGAEMLETEEFRSQFDSSLLNSSLMNSYSSPLHSSSLFSSSTSPSPNLSPILSSLNLHSVYPASLGAYPLYSQSPHPQPPRPEPPRPQPPHPEPPRPQPPRPVPPRPEPPRPEPPRPEPPRPEPPRPQPPRPVPPPVRPVPPAAPLPPQERYPSWLRDMIMVLLLNEMYGRRCARGMCFL